MTLLALILAAAASAAEPDLIIRGGKIFLSPGSYAEALSLKGNRIDAVGAAAEISKLAGPKTRVLELGGRTVVPGFHDAHAHFFKGALFLTQVDLNGSGTIEEVRRRVSEFAAANPDAPWIIGRGWDESALGARPTRFDVDAVVSTRPVALTDADGHKLLLNTEAMKRAGIGRQTPKLTKGEIIKDGEGMPTGLLVEDAMTLGQRAIPQYTREQKLAALRRALKHARESGVTSVQSMQGIVDTPLAEELDLWRELYKGRETTLRLFLYGRLEDAAQTAKLRKSASDFPRTRLGVEGVKGMVDGVLGARTAALLEPYFDEPKERGKPNYVPFRLNALVADAHKRGLQAALHAVGDRAVRLALDACERSQERAKAKGLVLPLYPCRIEHVEALHPDDAPRFAKLSAVASMQPSHLTYDNEEQNYNPNRLGDRVQTSFAWKTLEDAGATVAFGTDWPVMPLHPRIELFAAATRMHFNGRPENGWVPAQKVSLENAVVHYTLDPAKAVNRAEELGSIKPGKLADLVVFSGDLFSTTGLDLLKLEIDYTIFDGRIVYSRLAAQPDIKK